MSSRRWIGRHGLAVALVGVLAGCGEDDGGVPAAGGGEPQGGSGGAVTTGGGGGEPVIEEDPYDPPPAAPPLDDEALSSLGSQIDGLLDGMAAQTHSALVFGADTGQVIYERNPDDVLKPASNTKLFTSAAAMGALGEDHRVVTAVYASAAPSGGVVNGDLVLVGRHDFSWSVFFYDAPRFALDQIAQGLADAGVTQITGSAQVRGEVLWDGYQFSTYDAAAHRAAVATQFDAALVAAGISTGGPSTSSAMDPPPGATELGHWRSVPLAVGISPLNVVSHNEFADILSRHVGWEEAGESSYDGGEAEMLALLATAPTGAAGIEQLDLSEVNFDDGSGLSHGNRVAARHVVALMELMAERPEGLGWSRSFAVAGVRGTLAGRMAGSDTLGRFIGKTGTLNDTIALSGYLEHRHDGQRYLVSLLMNAVSSSSAARTAHNGVVEALAADLRQLGPRPESPVLESVKNEANGVSIRVSWSEVEGADGYLLWRSVDGKVWPREQARWVHASSHRTLPVEGDSLFVRVAAWSEAGPSDPSDVYAAAVHSEPSTMLVVDGNDRWQAQPSPENYLGGGHDFLRSYADALGGLGFDSCSNEAVVTGACPLEDYDAVLWSLGEESTEQDALDADERGLLTAYTDSGGNLFISGAELAWQLASGSDEELAFLNDVLRADYAGDDAETYTARFNPPLLGDGALLGFYTPDGMVVRYPDQLEPVNGSGRLVDYVGGAGGVAGVRYSGTYRLAYLGFPFESIDGADDRGVLLGEVLSFLSP